MPFSMLQKVVMSRREIKNFNFEDVCYHISRAVVVVLCHEYGVLWYVCVVRENPIWSLPSLFAVLAVGARCYCCLVDCSLLFRVYDVSCAVV